LLQQLKNLTRDSAIYGVGHIASRLLTFLLLPYYSFHLSPAEYGEMTLYFLFVGLAQAFFFYGLDIAYLRYFSLAKDPAQKAVVNGSTLMTTAATTGLLSLVLILAAPVIGRLVIHEPAVPSLVPAMVRLCAGILFFDTISTFPFMFLRGTLRPYHFTAVKLLNVVVNVGLNVWFVGRLDLSIPGVMWANFIASAVTTVVLLPSMLRETVFKWDKGLIQDMVRFGIPNIPTYLFVMVIELADRKIIELYRGAAESGLYSAGYKLGMFMAVVTGAFRFAWQPFFLSHAEQEDAPRLFARVLTYYLLVTFALFLALTYFIDPIIKTQWPGIGYILSPRYWPGLMVFPIILLAHIFDGVYANLMVGVYLKKLTSRLPIVTGAAALFTIVFNILLIPAYGMMAAAWITLIAFFMEAALLWLVVRRAYPVPYEWARIAKIGIACGIALVPMYVFNIESVWLRAGLLIGFFAVLILLGFFNDREKYHIRKLLRIG
jgi:O-antigen/teichoic acid export membrane protein